MNETKLIKYSKINNQRVAIWQLPNLTYNLNINDETYKFKSLGEAENKLTDIIIQSGRNV